MSVNGVFGIVEKVWKSSKLKFGSKKSTTESSWLDSAPVSAVLEDGWFSINELPGV